MAHHAVIVDDLVVEYGSKRALDGIDLRVEAGTTLGVLGHNGAGKTTLIRVLTTLIRPTRGRVVIDAIDAIREPVRVRRHIGATGQYAGLDDYLTTIENLEMIGRLVGLRRDARRRASELVDRFDMHALASRRVGELSGGSRRRVDLAASLVGEPSVLFLDEPTTGLDPTARSTMWEIVNELTTAGTTVVLTTQYLDEADRLADQVIVLDHGHIAARGTPSELKSLVGGKVVHATVRADHVDTLPYRPDASQRVDDELVRVSLTVPDASAATDVIASLASHAVHVTDLDVVSPSLDDVFFHLTTTSNTRSGVAS